MRLFTLFVFLARRGEKDLIRTPGRLSPSLILKPVQRCLVFTAYLKQKTGRANQATAGQRKDRNAMTSVPHIARVRQFDGVRG
jgi:hypothetical protein